MFEHYARNGSVLKTNLILDKEENILVIPDNLSLDKIASDIAEIIGIWTLTVYPYVDSFSGFDNIKFKIIKQSVSKDPSRPLTKNSSVSA